MNKIVNVASFGLFAILFAFSSCTMVKSPQSSNFQRVKYNGHIKMAKKQDKAQINEERAEVLQKGKLENVEGNKLQALSTIKLEGKPKYAYNELLRESLSKPSEASFNLQASKEASSIKQLRKNDLFWNPIEGFYENRESLVNVAPVSDISDNDWGTLLYILVIVLLALLILSILADLSGGLIGLLVAVLLVLVILRLLGYV